MSAMVPRFWAISTPIFWGSMSSGRDHHTPRAAAAPALCDALRRPARSGRKRCGSWKPVRPERIHAPGRRGRASRARRQRHATISMPCSKRDLRHCGGRIRACPLTSDRGSKSSTASAMSFTRGARRFRKLGVRWPGPSRASSQASASVSLLNTSPEPPRFCIISTPIFCGSMSSGRATSATRSVAPAALRPLGGHASSARTRWAGEPGEPGGVGQHVGQTQLARHLDGLRHQVDGLLERDLRDRPVKAARSDVSRNCPGFHGIPAGECAPQSLRMHRHL